MKNYEKKSEAKKMKIDEKIQEELKCLKVNDFDTKYGKIEVFKPQTYFDIVSKVYAQFYRECFQIVTPNDFDDDSIEKYLDDFEAKQENVNTRVPLPLQNDELMQSNRLTKEDKDLIA